MYHVDWLYLSHFALSSIIDWNKTRLCPREPAIRKIKIKTGFNNAYNANETNKHDNSNNANNH